MIVPFVPQKKVTAKDMQGPFASVPVSNYPAINKILSADNFWLSSSSVVRNLGKQLLLYSCSDCRLGVWMFKDVESGIRFVLWSDGWRKNPGWGTKIEVVSADISTPQALEAAFERLRLFLVAKNNPI